MSSAETGPDQKHALEALWRKWVFPLSVSTNGALHRCCPSQTLPGAATYAATTVDSLYRSPVIIMAQIILAILLASATAAIIGVRRASRCNCPFRKLCPNILMVKSAQDGAGDNGTTALDWPTIRDILVQ